MKNLKALIIAVIILIGIFFIAFIGINFTMRLLVGHKNEVKVPNLKGMDYNAALKKCKTLKLYLEQSKTINSNEIEKGKIISQNPHADIKTKRYRTVKVVVSAGAEMVRIPYLANLSITGAKLKLQNAGLSIGKKIYRYSKDVKKNRIISSQPMAEELIAKKGKVNVIVSLGKLPDASNKQNKYKNLLKKAGEE